MSDEPGGLVDGRYRLGALLGSGGSASVFEATDVSTGGTAAVKVLHPHLSSSRAHRERFIAGARAAIAVRGANVAAVLGAGSQGSGDARLTWIAMELAPGVSLAEAVEGGGPLSVASALAVADGVLAGLAAAHAVGVLHRDISPGNVMVRLGPAGEVAAGDVRLIDFGIASEWAGEPSEPQEIVGTASYVSPEQAAGVALDARGDLYQLGGVLFFALTGRAPFIGSSVGAVLEAHRSSPPPVPSVSRPGLPRAVDRLVVRAMVKHPDGRFASAAAMRTAVREAAAGVQTAAAGGREGAAEPTRVIGGATVALAAPGRAGATTPAQQARRAGRRPRRARPTGGGGERLVGAGRVVAPLLVAALVAGAWLLAAAAPPLPEAPSAGPSPSTTAMPEAQGAAAAPRAAVVRVPEIGGAVLADARSALSAAGLVVGGLVIQDSSAPGDTVLAVVPGPGAVLAVGSSVDLVVASGANVVPAVVGLAEGEAAATIRAAGFGVQTRTQRGDGPSGAVVGSEPAAGTVVRLGEEVLLFVAEKAPSGPGTPSEPSVSPTPAPTGTPSTAG